MNILKIILNWLFVDNSLLNFIDKIIEYLEKKFFDIIFITLPLLIIAGEFLFFCFSWLKYGVGQTHSLCEELGYGRICFSMPRTDYVGLDKILIWFGSHSVAYIASLVLVIYLIHEEVK